MTAPTPKNMRVQPDMLDDAGMVKTSKFKDTVNRDDDGMLSRMMSRMTTRKNTKKEKNRQRPSSYSVG